MIFSSSSFILFFLALLALYSITTSHRQRAALLLVGSIIFYASWKPAYLILLFSSLWVNYHLYLVLLKKPSKKLLILGIVANLSVLAFYKYLGLLIETGLWFLQLGALTTTAQAPGWMDWALPLGISFFTFQMLSALIDVYRGNWDRVITFPKWCLYVSFFPQLIAGPIVRAHELIKQLDDLKPLQQDNLRIGAVIFVGGLIKKIFLADNIAPIVDMLYAEPDGLNFTLAWFAAIAFGLQIYFDFSGYSDMALGLAKMLGIDLPRNFRYPYMSRNFSEFWQRWHITLSQWLRDYLYIPMGGSRCKTSRVYQNLLATMLLGGLWHGAGWTFVFWGGLHGIYLIGHRLLIKFYSMIGIVKGSIIARLLSYSGLPVTLILTAFTWVFFRATTFDDAWLVSSLMLGLHDNETVVLEVRLYQYMIVVMGMVAVAVEPLIVKFGQRFGVQWWWSFPYPIRGVCYAVLALSLVVFGGDTQKFVYFDF